MLLLGAEALATADAILVDRKGAAGRNQDAALQSFDCRFFGSAY
jgi:hypothetical protein